MHGPTRLPVGFKREDDKMLEKMQLANFAQIFSIMEESFPLDEYRPYEEQKSLLKESKYGIYILPDSKSGNIKAFISVWQFTDFAYIEHFAVARKYRSQGLGSLILDEIRQILACQICLEVELPENDLAKRRIEFYKRNGFFLNAYPYLQPPISKGRNPLPLMIMTSQSPIPEDRFETIKTVLYQNVYKVDRL